MKMVYDWNYFENFLYRKNGDIISFIILGMGWLIVIDIRTLFEIITTKAKLLLIAGGVSYGTGRGVILCI